MITQDNKGNVSPKGAVRIILIDGLLIKGGFFAIGMLVGGFFIKGHFSSFTLSDYLTSAETWVSFAYYFFFFGLLMGLFEYVKGKKT